MFNKDTVYTSGSTPGAGIYKCLICGDEVSIKDGEALPLCPKCKQETFKQIA